MQAQRFRLVCRHVEAQGSAIALEHVPAYAPVLNPVECIRDYLKHDARCNLRSGVMVRFVQKVALSPEGHAARNSRAA